MSSDNILSPGFYAVVQSKQVYMAEVVNVSDIPFWRYADESKLYPVTDAERSEFMPVTTFIESPSSAVQMGPCLWCGEPTVILSDMQLCWRCRSKGITIAEQK